MCRRSSLYLRVSLALVLLAGSTFALPAAAQKLPPPFGPETGDALAQTVRELRRCIGPLDAQTTPAFVGVRFLCNAFEMFHAAARRALESVAGIDVNGGQRGQNSLLETWRQAGVPEDEIQSLQRTATSTFYGWTGAPESETSEDDTIISGWQDFQKNTIPITENAHGREALFRANLLARQANVQTAVENLAAPGQPYPEFRGEREAAAVAAAAVGAGATNPILAAALAAEAGRLATNDIAVPAQKNSDALALLTTLLPLAVVSGDSPLAPTARSNPSDPLVNSLRGASAQETVQAAALGNLTAGGLGRTGELSGLGEAQSSIPSDIINRDILNTFAQRAANAVTNRFNSIANATNFLGPTAGSLANLLGPDNFRDAASNLFSGPGGTPQFPGFPPGGGPRRLADIPNTPPRSEASCANRQPTISPDAARGLAVFLGLPPATDPANPWELQYLEAQRAYRQQGIDPSTGAARTIAQEDFPNPTTCVWVISHAPPGQSRTAAFIEDSADSSRASFLLRISR